MHNIPLQFGFRVAKEWKQYHHFTVSARKLAGGPPLPIPTRVPTSSPTETRTWIAPLIGTNYKEQACPSYLDRSSVSEHPYEVRGVGGGGAMSGLSISPWDDLWFVGTDMGTLFRSTDSGSLWYPGKRPRPDLSYPSTKIFIPCPRRFFHFTVSHYEAKYHSSLIVSIPVGYTSNPMIVLHASCHEDADDESANRDCIAQRSIDGGVTWSPVE